jgi:hypothetical protein
MDLMELCKIHGVRGISGCLWGIVCVGRSCGAHFDLVLGVGGQRQGGQSSERQEEDKGARSEAARTGTIVGPHHPGLGSSFQGEPGLGVQGRRISRGRLG